MNIRTFHRVKIEVPQGDAKPVVVVREMGTRGDEEHVIDDPETETIADLLRRFNKADDERISKQIGKL
jgi:hypothetical protein